MTSSAPRLVEMNASPVIQAGIDLARGEKVLAGFHVSLKDPTDAQNEHDIDRHDGIIDGANLDMRHGFPFQGKDERKLEKSRGIKPLKIRTGGVGSEVKGGFTQKALGFRKRRFPAFARNDRTWSPSQNVM